MRKFLSFVFFCLAAYLAITSIIDNISDNQSFSSDEYTGYYETTTNASDNTSDLYYPTDETTRDRGSSSTTKKSNSKTYRAANYIPDKSICYHYRQLDTYGKEIYDLLLENAASGDVSFKLNLRYDGSYYEESMLEAVYGFVQDHPEFFWLARGYSYSYKNNSMKLTLATRDFWDVTMFHKKYTEPFFDKVDQIVSLAEKYETDYDKAVFVHDYIASITTYDHDAAADNDDGNWSINSDYAFSSYGGLVNGKFVCGGYSAAFQLIMQQFGIECTWVAGDAGGYHAWNLVKLDGEYYWLDLTWDDVDEWTTSDGKISYLDGVCHSYFALTDNEFFLEHTPEIYNYDKCTAIANNYHKREGYYISNYSEKSLTDIMTRQINERQTDITFKFANKSDYEKGYSYIWNNAYNILELCGYTGGHTFYTNEETLSFEICLLERYQ